MTNKKLLDTWNKFLAEELHCYADQNGNRPCDNGAMCDKCMTDEMLRDYAESMSHAAFGWDEEVDEDEFEEYCENCSFDIEESEEEDDD